MDLPHSVHKQLRSTRNYQDRHLRRPYDAGRRSESFGCSENRLQGDDYWSAELGPRLHASNIGPIQTRAFMAKYHIISTARQLETIPSCLGKPELHV